MTRQEVKEMIRKTGILFDEDHPDHITAGKAPEIEPPFLEYVLTDTTVMADGIRYIDIKGLAITLWSDTEECEEEKAIENVLLEEGLRWKVNREFTEEAQLWAIVYNLEV